MERCRSEMQGKQRKKKHKKAKKGKNKNDVRRPKATSLATKSLANIQTNTYCAVVFHYKTDNANKKWSGQPPLLLLLHFFYSFFPSPRSPMRLDIAGLCSPHCRPSIYWNYVIMYNLVKNIGQIYQQPGDMAVVVCICSRLIFVLFFSPPRTVCIASCFA